MLFPKQTLIIILTFWCTYCSADIFLDQTCSCDIKKEYKLNCNKYFECSSGQLFLKDCNPGKFFDEKKQKCVPPNESSCENNSECHAQDWIGGSCFCSNTNGLIGSYEWDCGKFYQCSGILYLMNCPPGQYFDENKLRCVRPGETECKLPCDTTPTPTPTTTPTPTPTPTVTPGQCPDDGSFYEECRENIDAKPYENEVCRYFTSVSRATILIISSYFFLAQDIIDVD